MMELYEKGKKPELSFSPPCEDTAQRSASQEEGLSQETNHAGVLVSDFWSPELGEVIAV